VKRIVATTLMLAMFVAPASAGTPPQPGIAMSWTDCAGGVSATQDQAFACDNNVSQFPLACAAALDSSVDGVIGAELVVDVQLSTGSMPDWWRLDGSGTGGCRAGGITASFDFSSSPRCTDAWAGQGFGNVASFTIGPPDHPQMNQARIKAVAAVTSDHAATLTPGFEYGFVLLKLSATRTTGAGACAGCALSACLVLNSILVRRLPASGADVYLTSTAGPSANWATWQGTGADCAAVPARRRTWGEIKSLYR
jgi:hypothetical protein